MSEGRDTCAMKAWKGRHAFISFAHSGQINLAAEYCQSFALDNGAFTAWKAAGKNKIDWSDYYEFVARWKNHPGFDFAIIPDVIDGGEDENEALLDEWPHGEFYGVPVWHMNESDERFIRLCNEYPRVAIGSCGDYDVKRPNLAVARMKDLIRHVIDEHGQTSVPAILMLVIAISVLSPRYRNCTQPRTVTSFWFRTQSQISM